MNIFLALLGLSLIILIHELGHFIAARIFKIKIIEFSIFMGPKLVSKKIGNTIYSIRLIPFGGYVKMVGEEESSDDSGAFCAKPVWQRMFVTAAGAIFNVLFALLVFTLTYAATGTLTNKVESIAEGSSAAIAGIMPGDKIVLYNNKRFYSYPDFDILTYGEDEGQVNITVKRDSVKKEFTITPVRHRYIMGVMMGARESSDFNVIISVSENSPASKSGLSAGDRILKIDGKELLKFTDLAKYLGAKDGGEVDILVSRDGNQIHLNLTPVRERVVEYAASGLTLEFIKTWNPLPNIKESWLMCTSLVRSSYVQIAWMITGKVPAKEIRGPVGIVDVIGEVVTEVKGYGLLVLLVSFLQLMALISVNIGVLQVLPIPALDGGRLLTQLVEAIRRKSLPPEKEMYITYAGFILFIIMFILVTFNDIKRWIG